jgi:hypothetical protein
MKRIAVPRDVQSHTSLAHADYQDALLIDAPDATSDSAEQWIRSMFESASAPIRTFVRLGWLMFGAKLGPYPSPGHVAGWQIGESRPDVVRLEVEWTIGLRAQLVLRTQPSSVVFATFVEHNRRAARILWPTLVPLHQLMVRHLISRAVRVHSARAGRS